MPNVNITVTIWILDNTDVLMVQTCLVVNDPYLELWSETDKSVWYLNSNHMIRPFENQIKLSGKSCVYILGGIQMVIILDFLSGCQPWCPSLAMGLLLHQWGPAQRLLLAVARPGPSKSLPRTRQESHCQNPFFPQWPPPAEDLLGRGTHQPGRHCSFNYLVASLPRHPWPWVP